MLSAIIAALALGSTPADIGDAPQSAPNAQAQARQDAFLEQRFVQAGFPPIPRTAPREFRRLLLGDPYNMLAVPGIEVARGEDGSATLTLQHPEWTTDPVRLEPGAWEGLLDDETLFAVQPSNPGGAADSGRPPRICHGWSASIQSDDGRIASWHGCSGAGGPVQDAAVEMVRLAMATRPDCAFDPASPFFAFNTCFRAGPGLDDPELEAVFSVLRTEYHDAPALTA